jgi:hypothetical protein
VKLRRRVEEERKEKKQSKKRLTMDGWMGGWMGRLIDRCGDIGPDGAGWVCICGPAQPPSTPHYVVTSSTEPYPGWAFVLSWTVRYYLSWAIIISGVRSLYCMEDGPVLSCPVGLSVCWPVCPLSVLCLSSVGRSCRSSYSGRGEER